MHGRGDCRHGKFGVMVGGNYRHFFFSGFRFLASSLCQGECFAPFPGRLGRFTSGQELQVSVTLAASN